MAKQAFMDPDDLVIIGLDTEHRDGDHPLYDPRAFKETSDRMVKNILLYGVQENVLVRREGGKALVVAGRQRVKAARAAKKIQQSAGAEHHVKVPVTEVHGDDKHIYGIMVTENELRSDDDILDKALKAARMLAMGMDDDEICLSFGRSKHTIEQWLTVANAAPELHAAYKHNKIGSMALFELAKLDRSEQVESLAIMMKTGEVQGSSEKITASAARKVRREVTGSSATDETTALAAPEVRPGADGTVRRNRRGHKQAKQQGVKRSWLRIALKTAAAEKLKVEYRRFMRWIAYGEAEPESWMHAFMEEASAELVDKAYARAERKAAAEAKGTSSEEPAPAETTAPPEGAAEGAGNKKSKKGKPAPSVDSTVTVPEA